MEGMNEIANFMTIVLLMSTYIESDHDPSGVRGRQLDPRAEESVLVHIRGNEPRTCQRIIENPRNVMETEK